MFFSANCSGSGAKGEASQRWRVGRRRSEAERGMDGDSTPAPRPPPLAAGTSRLGGAGNVGCCVRLRARRRRWRGEWCAGGGRAALPVGVVSRAGAVGYAAGPRLRA